MRRRAGPVLVIANPAAGLRPGRDAGETVARIVRSAGRDAELARTQAPGDAQRWAAAARLDRFEMILAVGGDGTAHEAANGVAGSDLPLGVVPTGTMNLLARVLKLPMDPATAAELLVTASRRKIVTPGRAGRRLFLLMAGIGLDAWVLGDLLAGRRGKIGFHHYLAGGLRGAWAYPFPAIRFRFPGGEMEGTAAILGRSELYGGFLRPTPRVSLERAELELCVLNLRSFAGCLGLLPALWSGSHLGRRGVADRLVSEVAASSDSTEVPIQLDGELAGRLPMEFGLSERKLVLLH